MEATEFLQTIYDDKKDISISDFKVICGDSIINVTPEIIAEMFACMGSDEQALFFNHVDKVASSWNGGRGYFPMQLQYITDEDGLTLAGRRVMQEIGNYSHWGLSNIKLNG